MTQFPPILVPFADNECNNNSNSVDKTVNKSESIFNGLIKNENKSPTVSNIFESDSKNLPIFNIQYLFSTLSKSDYDDDDNSRNEKREISDSLFEKIYKDYSATFNIGPMFSLMTNDKTISSNINENIETIKSQENISKNPNNNHIYKNHKRKQFQRKIIENGKIKEKERNHNISFDHFKLKSLKSSDKTSNDEIIKNVNDVERSHDLTKYINEKRFLRSPFITFRRHNTKKITPSTKILSQCYQIVNPALKLTDNHYQTIYKPKMKYFKNRNYSKSITCVCAFCGETSTFLNLGNLYGPYFISKNYLHMFPFTAIFPGENKEIKESDNNDNVKTSVQPMESSSNNTICVEDYRVTCDGEVWFHMECIIWAPGTYLRGDGKIGGLFDALKMALTEKCFGCQKIGAILNCNTKNCKKNFHYYCAISHGSKLNNDQFSIRCNKHRDII